VMLWCEITLLELWNSMELFIRGFVFHNIIYLS
jgi:hypothetical protein